MCFYWDSMQKKTTQLSLNEIEKLSKSLPNLLQLTLTGGEPSLRKDLSEIPKIFAKYRIFQNVLLLLAGCYLKE